MNDAMLSRPETAEERAQRHAQAVEDFFGPPISIYTRAQAIEDGVLVDVTETAREAGFRCPVALTSEVWADCVEWTEADKTSATRACQDEAGRLWDVLWMGMIAGRRGVYEQTIYSIKRRSTWGSL